MLRKKKKKAQEGLVQKYREQRYMCGALKKPGCSRNKGFHVNKMFGFFLMFLTI